MTEPLTVIVPGGAGGIGYPIVQTLLRHGYHVLIADLREPAGALPDRCSFFAHDVKDEKSWQELAAFAEAEFGAADSLVNCAGIGGKRHNLVDTPSAEFDDITRTNLWGTWFGMKVFHDQLRRSQQASIVNVSSIYGLRPPPQDPSAPVSPAYQASKAGVIMLTRTAAVEFADDDITVNSVAPGLFETPLLSLLSQEQINRRVNAAPLRRPGDPQELAELVAFLIGPNARFITGANIPIDGGFLAA